MLVLHSKIRIIPTLPNNALGYNAHNHCKWIEIITRQQDLMRERSQFIEMNILSEIFSSP